MLDRGRGEKIKKTGEERWENRQKRNGERRDDGQRMGVRVKEKTVKTNIREK